MLDLLVDPDCKQAGRSRGGGAALLLDIRPHLYRTPLAVTNTDKMLHWTKDCVLIILDTVIYLGFEGRPELIKAINHLQGWIDLFAIKLVISP